MKSSAAPELADDRAALRAPRDAPCVVDGRVRGRRPSRWRPGWIVALAFVLGASLRVGAVFLPEAPRFNIDYYHFIAWEREILAKGLFRSYGEPGRHFQAATGVAPESSSPPRTRQLLPIPRDLGEGGEPSGALHSAVTAPGETPERLWVLRPNYPPAFQWVLGMCAVLHRALDPELAPHTPTATAVFLVPTFAFDLALSLACAGIVAALGVGRRGAIASFAWLWCGPTFWLDFAMYHQVDGWVCAWIALAWLALLRERWSLGGAFAALALFTKPHGALALALVLLALLHRYVDRPSTRGAPRALLPAAAGFVLTALALALPFHLAEGSRWLEAGFLYNAASHPLGNQGSWYSANTWMIVQMLTGRQEASALLLGMSWHMWGTLLFLALAVPAGVGWWRRWRLDPRGWGVLLGLLVVIGFYSMTRMVERYLLFAVPFVVVNAQCIGGRMWRWANVWLTALVALHLSRSAWWEVSLEPLGWAPEATPAALATLACAAGLAGTTWLVLSTLRGPTATTEAIGA